MMAFVHSHSFTESSPNLFSLPFIARVNFKSVQADSSAGANKPTNDRGELFFFL